MIEVLKLSAILTIGIVASLIVFGFIIGKLELMTNNLMFRSLGKYSIIFTGVIGTTVHEFSHYIMCKIFMHKVISVKWFSLNLKNSELGFVNHSYNPKNIYQRVGNFFIGVAPIFMGTTIIMICYRFLLKDSFYTIASDINFNNYILLGEHFNIINFIKLIFIEFYDIFTSIFTLNNIKTFQFWIFLFIAMSISTHMSLSKADLKNSLDGIVAISLISLFISTILLVFNVSINLVISKIIIANIIIVSFLSIGLFFSFITLIIAKFISLKDTFLKK